MLFVPLAGEGICFCCVSSTVLISERCLAHLFHFKLHWEQVTEIISYLKLPCWLVCLCIIDLLKKEKKQSCLAFQLTPS